MCVCVCVRVRPLTVGDCTAVLLTTRWVAIACSIVDY